MSPLRGLRTNCLLAPSTAALCGAVAVLLAWTWHRDALAAAEAATRRAEIEGIARLVETGAAPAAAAWLEAHPGCIGIGRWRLDGDRLVAADAAGPPRSEPGPELVLAFQAPRTWREGELLAAAAPALPTAGQPLLVAGWWTPAAPPPARAWLVLAGGVLVIGGGLGAYLVARVYRPVRWLERAAQAAAAGTAEPDGRVDSPETESLRSSIALIMARHGPDEHGQQAAEKQPAGG